MLADGSVNGPRTAVRLPVLVALLTVATGLLAALVPALLAQSSAHGAAVERDEAAIVAAADTSRDRIKGFISDQAAAVTCLASDNLFEEQVAKASEVPPPELTPTKEGERPEEPTEEQRVQKATREAILTAQEKVAARLKAFCEGRPACKRAVIASKASAILFSTAKNDAGGTFSGTLVTSAIDSGAPVPVINAGLTGQLGAPLVIAARLPSKERVLLASFEMNELFDGLSKVARGLGEGGRILVADGRRSALFGGFESTKGKALEIEPVVRALKGESATSRTADEEEKVVFSAFRPIPEAGAVVVALRRTEHIGGGGASFPVGGLIAGLVLGIIMGVVVFVLARKAFDPVQLLLDSAQRVARGDLSERVPVLTDDEVGAISRVWNELVAELQKLKGGGPPAAGGNQPGGPLP